MCAESWRFNFSHLLKIMRTNDEQFHRNYDQKIQRIWVGSFWGFQRIYALANEKPLHQFQYLITRFHYSVDLNNLIVFFCLSFYLRFEYWFSFCFRQISTGRSKSSEPNGAHFGAGARLSNYRVWDWKALNQRRKKTLNISNKLYPKMGAKNDEPRSVAMCCN